MSKITDAVNAAEANFATIRTGIAALDQKIIDLQSVIKDPTPEEQAALDVLVADSAALAAAASQMPSTSTEPTEPAA